MSEGLLLQVVFLKLCL